MYSISRGNPELEYILDKRIPFQSMAALLHDEFLKGKQSLVVAGTHGKTTTTSMLSWIFAHAGRNPSFLIGGIAENFGSSFAVTDGREFILEGDEYDTAFFDKGPKFLHYFPDDVILTSVEFDHADIYKSLDEVKTAFKRLVNLVPRRGRVIVQPARRADARAGPARGAARLAAGIRPASVVLDFLVWEKGFNEPETPEVPHPHRIQDAIEVVIFVLDHAGVIRSDRDAHDEALRQVFCSTRARARSAMHSGVKSRCR